MLSLWADAFMTATLTDRHQDGARETRRRAPSWLRVAGRRLVGGRVARSLREMDDHLLRDVGLTRGEAERLARTAREPERG